MAKVRDKLWMFGVRAHQDDVNAAHSHCNRRRSRSRITPAEGALMLDIPNMIMVCCESEPAPFSEEAYGYAESFITMDKVMWSASSTGGGYHTGVEEEFICKLAEEYPNITGAFLDDFMVSFRGKENANELAVDFLTKMRSKLDNSCRPLDLYMVWYTYEVENTKPDVIDLVDGITLWTWNNDELPLLEERFEKIEKAFPDKKKMLGIYIYDFPNHRSVPLELMELQCNLALKLLKEHRIEGIIIECNLALKLLKEHRIEGIIIECNATMGMGFDSEYMLRDWIKQVKNTELDW